MRKSMVAGVMMMVAVTFAQGVTIGVDTVDPMHDTSLMAAYTGPHAHFNSPAGLMEGMDPQDPESPPWVFQRWWPEGTASSIAVFDYQAELGKTFAKVNICYATMSWEVPSLAYDDGTGTYITLTPTLTYLGKTANWDAYLASYDLSGLCTDRVRIAVFGDSWWTPLISSVSLTMTAGLQGTVILDGYAGPKDAAGFQFVLHPVAGGDDVVRRVFLDSDGTFLVDNIVSGEYDITVKGLGTLSARVEGVLIDGYPTVLTEPIVLKSSDGNGDDRISFGDFAFLQNRYGQAGAAASPVAHVVDGVLSAGEWVNWYSDPMGDQGTGSVDLVGWGAEVQDGVFYAALALNPNWLTVAQYNDYEGGKRIWLSVWFDVDPDSDPPTGVSEGSCQFDPQVHDIYIELGTDDGTLEGSNGWHSLNLWGRGNDFGNSVPVSGSFAYSDYIVEFSCPMSAILAELPNTDGAVPAAVWSIAARGAGLGFGGDYSGDITTMESMAVSGGTAVQGQQGDMTPASAANPLAAATGGCGPLGLVLITILALALHCRE